MKGEESKACHTPGPWVVAGEMKLVGQPTDKGGQHPHFCGYVNPGADEYRGDVCYLQSADHIGGIGRDEAEANARLIASAPDLLALLSEVADEFGGAIAQYHKLGPDFTHKDGTEVFDVGVVLDREPLIERIRVAIARATGEAQ